MTDLPARYIHGIDVDTATTLERFAAAAAEAEYHLNEALKSMKASQGFLNSADVAADHRERGVDRDYIFRTLVGLREIAFGLKADHGTLMFGDSSVAPSLLIEEPIAGPTPAPTNPTATGTYIAVAGGRPTPPASALNGSEHVPAHVPGGPYSVFDGAKPTGHPLPQVHRGEDR